MSTDRDSGEELRHAFAAVDPGPGADPALLVAGAHRSARRRRHRQVAGAGLAALATVVAALVLPGALTRGAGPDADLPVAATNALRPETIQPIAPPASSGPAAVTGIRLGQSVDSPEGTGMCALAPGCPRVVFDVVGTAPGTYDLQCWIDRGGRVSKFFDGRDVVEVLPDGGHVDSTYCAVAPDPATRVRIFLTDGPSRTVGSEWTVWAGA